MCKVTSVILHGVVSPKAPAFEFGSWSRSAVERGENTIERQLFNHNLLVRIRIIIEMIWWTGLASWEAKFPSPGSRVSTFL